MNNVIVSFQWIMSQLLKGSLKNWGIRHSTVVCSGSSTDFKSSEPLKTLAMLCYVYVMCMFMLWLCYVMFMLCLCYVMFMLCYAYVMFMLCYVKDMEMTESRKTEKRFIKEIQIDSN